MQDPTPAPEYQPRPSGSSTGTVLAVLAAVVALGVLCCGGVLMLGFAFRAQAVPMPVQPPPVIAPQPPMQPVPPPTVAPPAEAPDTPATSDR